LAKQFEQNGQLHVALGQWLLEQGQDDLALSELLRAQATGIVDGRFTLALAAVQARSGAYVDAAGNAALVEKKSAIDLKVRAGAALLAGSSYMSEGQDKEAIEHLRHAIELAPDVEANYLALSRIYEVLDDHKSAVEVLSQGRSKISASPDFLIALGANLTSVDKFDEAIEILSAIVSKFPEKTTAYERLAGAYRITGEAAQASNIFAQAR